MSSRTENSESPTPQPSPKSSRWAGTSLWWIAGLHTVVGLAAGLRLMPDPQMDRLAGDRVPLLELSPGFAASPGVDALQLTMFWFLFFGFVLAMLGSAIRSLEKSDKKVPRAMGYQLIALGISGGIFLPASGFWLALIPAYNVLRQRRAA